jgi:hypothetical protein
MTTEQARAVFNEGISDLRPDQRANRELLREFLTNPEFSKYLKETTFQINSKR